MGICLPKQVTGALAATTPWPVPAWPAMRVDLHYVAAEKLLIEADRLITTAPQSPLDDAVIDRVIARAQVHALLATFSGTVPPESLTDNSTNFPTA